jgi:endoglucanase
MNEPHNMPTSLVLVNDQTAIDGIGRPGTRQLILAPGNGYTGGHAWLQSSQGDEPSGDYLSKIHNPIENRAIRYPRVSRL